MPNGLIDIDYLPINVAIYKYDGNDFIFVDFNKQAQLTEKITKSSIIGKKLTDIFPTIKEFGLFDVLIRVHKTGQKEVFESTFYKDSRISGWRKNEIVKLENGNIAAFYTDSSVQKELEEHGLKLELQLSEAESKLEEQKSIFLEVIEKAESIAVQGYDENHRVIYWNKGSENLYGYTYDEAVGKKLEDLIIPKYMKSMIFDAVENWILHDIEMQSSELTLVHKDVTTVHTFSHYSMIKTNSDKSEMYCININLNEIKKLQKVMNEQKNFLNTMLDVIPDVVWLKDLDGKYLKCNSKFEQLYGEKEVNILDHTDFDFVDEKQAKSFRENYKIALDSGKSHINEEYLIFADGSHEGLFETIKTPMKNENGDIIGVLGIARDIKDRKEKEKQLEFYAHYDPLTGLANRALFTDRLTQLLNKRDIQDKYHCILFIDLDHFKDINDTLGHSVGDKVLTEASRRIKQSVRKGDTVSRLGGDEFTVLLEDINSPQEAELISKKIISVLREPFYIDGYETGVTASIGIAISPNDAITPDELLNCADKAMYRAKANQKDTYEFFNSKLEK